MVSSQRVIVALFLSLALLTLIVPAIATSQLVLEVGPTKVNLKEYEDFYMRNSGGWEVAKQSSQADREHFLELLTNYNLKLLDAKDRNLANDSEIVRELQDYRMSLSSTFMLDRELTEPALRQMYERRKEELRVQRILISLRPEASVEESTKAYAKAADIIKRAKSGENFDTLAVKYSEIPSAKTDGGDLYYITGGTMNLPFENAAYGMQKGQISDVPVRTPFGYEVIKVNDRKPVRGKVKVRHIMAIFKTMNPDSAEDRAAYGRIRAMQDSLKKGWEFQNVATKFSEDVGSAPNGGDLGPAFSRARWVLPFDEVCFKLNVGEVSGIVRTPLGYHIIRCDSVYPLASFEEMKDELKQLYQKYRYQQDYNELIAKLKSDYHFKFIESVFDLAVSELDSTAAVGDSGWDAKLSGQIRGLTMFMFKGRSITVDSAFDAMGRRPEFRGTQLKLGELRKKIDQLAEGFLLAEKARTLESRYPEFAALMKEYNDGILLYKAEQMEVWGKSSVSDSALKKFYADNTDKFMLPEQVNIAEIDVASDTLGALLYDSLMHGANFAKLSKRHNTDEDLRGKGGERGMLPVTTDDITKMSIGMKVGSISEPMEIGNGGYTIIKLLKREPARPKTYEEAGAEVSNLYQEQRSKDLEREWLDRLKQKYPVKQYKDQLSKAFANPRSEKAL
jgi:peptidyl-prolyl cis-trans isomerase SurA